jgi:hypothetical protein
MKARNRIIMSITLILSLILLTAVPAASVGLGVSPQEFVIEDALRGNIYQETITVFNPDDVENTYGLSVSDNFIDWVKYYYPDNPDKQITSLTISARSNQSILVEIAIPADAPNGNYKGQLQVKTSTGEAGEMGDSSGVGVGMQIPVMLDVTVTGTQIISGVVGNMKVEDTEVGYPLRIGVVFENTGNVAVKPLINTIILYNDQDVADLSIGDTQVPIRKSQVIEMEWDTTGTPPDKYSAKVEVILNGEVLAEEVLDFEILPLGTFSRSGELKGIEIEGSKIVNMTSKIKATFFNSGQIDAMAGFSGEVYLGGNLIDVITSDQLLVRKGHEEILTAYFKPELPGEYTILGHVNFEGKKSEIKEVSLVVEELTDITLSPAENDENQDGSNSPIMVYAIIGVVMAALVCVIGVVAVKKRKSG